MALVFGISSIKLKSFTPEELKIKERVPADSVIELRNTYFHLFWIPFFPLRKRWFVVNAGKKYALAGEVENKILLQKLTPRTPLLLYVGSSLLILAILFVVTWNSVLTARGRSWGKDLVNNEISALMQKISTADTFDYFVIQEKTDFDRTILMKVIDAAGENISFKKLHVNIKPNKMDSLKIKQIVPSFQNTNDTVFVNKEILRKSYKGNSFLTGEIRDGQDMFHDGKKYYLLKVYKQK